MLKCLSRIAFASTLTALLIQDLWLNSAKKASIVVQLFHIQWKMWKMRFQPSTRTHHLLMPNKSPAPCFFLWMNWSLECVLFFHMARIDLSTCALWIPWLIWFALDWWPLGPHAMKLVLQPPRCPAAFCCSRRKAFNPWRLWSQQLWRSHRPFFVGLLPCPTKFFKTNNTTESPICFSFCLHCFFGLRILCFLKTFQITFWKKHHFTLLPNVLFFFCGPFWKEKLMAFQKLSSKHSQIRRMVRRDISHPSVAAAWVAGPWSDCIPCPGVGERKTWGVAGIRNPLMNMFSWLFFIGIFIMVDDIIPI